MKYLWKRLRCGAADRLWGFDYHARGGGYEYASLAQERIAGKEKIDGLVFFFTVLSSCVRRRVGEVFINELYETS